MIFSTFNVFCGLLVLSVIALKLLRWSHDYNLAERFGMGLIGAGMLLTIPTLFPLPPHTPFDYWANSLLRIGCAVYFLGRLSRRYPLIGHHGRR